MRNFRLETERLIIREYEMADLATRHRIYNAAFEAEQTLDESRAWLDWTVRNYRELEKLHQSPYGDYAVIAKETAEMVGSVGLVQALVPWGVFAQYRRVGEAENTLVQPEFGLFWAIDPVQWGRGYAPEAARAMIAYVFREVGARRVVATTENDNLKSQRVMVKLGMTVAQNPGKVPFWFQTVGVLANTI